MAELKKLLSALIKGNGSFEQVNAAIKQFLARSPDKAPLVAKLLSAARDAGLSHPMYVSLSGHVTAHIATGRDPEATVLALDDEPRKSDRTAIVLKHPAPGTDATAQQGASEQAASAEGGPALARSIPDPLPVSEQKTEIMTPPGRRADEATQMEAGLDGDRTAVNPDLDLTERLDEQRQGPGRADVPEINPTTGDATRTCRDATDKTIALDGDVDFDIFSEESLASAEEAADPDTGANWPTIRDPQHPGLSRGLQEGDHLRDRFQLMSKLGEGGMGAVWKGKDLLKEEARDRNPFVAIKLLQGDFKEHPEAFIALQRETAKQQRLAHPNIATVYDFDRDDSSNTVFMTMEVLEGQPLDAFIRKLPPGGLPVEEAMPLVEQLCNGLAYAHSHGLVHADLKPGNCFYTKDGTIKLLDFGIARASKTKADAEGETTLFDPSELGALTPTYATVEMFEGVDPDPRDDIYALAIMTYQLLTGEHPYGRKAAPKARELGLKPEPIAKLNKRQNKALARGLAFEREDRTPTVEEFFESVRPRKGRAPMFMVAGLAAVITVGVAAYGPVIEFVNKYHRERIDSVIEDPGIEKIRERLDQARTLDNPEFRRIQISPPRRGECSTNLAGSGRRRGGECWDLTGRAKGPLMVVVPAGGAITAPFAISKYEISGSDFNRYCMATGKCQSLPRSMAKLPLTSVSAEQAKAYARWLSAEASKTEKRTVVYRLPTEAEWEHAASAGGAQPAKKFNCRVTAGGGVISGHALADATSGAQNGWGLANYVGNAQEWVRAPGGLKARGGTYQDPLSRCDASISRDHSGEPDGVTGFRLVREMG